MSLHGLPVREVEPYLDRHKLAELMGVSVWTVDRLVKQGMPSEQWGLRVRRFRASTVFAWLRERQDAA